MSYDREKQQVDWRVTQAMKGFPEYAKRRALVVFLWRLNVIPDEVVVGTLTVLDGIYL